MTEPFVGRCNNTEDPKKSCEILNEIQDANICDFNLLIDLAKDRQSGHLYRMNALRSAVNLNDKHGDQYHDVLLTVIDQILTYDENGEPDEKNKDLRHMAFEAVAHLCIVARDEAEFSKWRERVSKDPYFVIRFLAEMRLY